MQDNKDIVRNSVLVNSRGTVHRTVIANITLMQISQILNKELQVYQEIKKT